MEDLLNKLMSKGWKPFGNDYVEVMDNDDEISFKFKPYVRDNYKLRQLTAKESGLWQFVCENGMIEKGGLFWELGYSSGEIDLESRVRRQDYEYRIIESALCNEDSLEKFLLENIKIS